MVDSGGPHSWRQVNAGRDRNPGCYFCGPRRFLVPHQGALQETSEGVEGADLRGATVSSVDWQRYDELGLLEKQIMGWIQAGLV